MGTQVSPMLEKHLLTIYQLSLPDEGVPAPQPPSEGPCDHRASL